MLAISLIKNRKRKSESSHSAVGDAAWQQPQLHILLGQVYYDQGETAKALEELKAALALDGKTRLAHFYSGLVYINLGKLDEAARAFESELAINPNDIQAKYHLGFVLLADQQSERGISSC